MDLMTAIRERRSCRDFSPEAVDEETLERVLQAAVWAPSPLNGQPWEFVVVTNGSLKARIAAEAERCRDWAVEASGWKWLAGYRTDFLQSVPVMVAVVGNPQKTGVDQFMGEARGYQHACAAAVQNMLLAAHAEGLGSLWFTFFDRTAVSQLLAIDPSRQLVALVCLGRPAGPGQNSGRRDAREKTTYLR